MLLECGLTLAAPRITIWGRGRGLRVAICKVLGQSITDIYNSVNMGALGANDAFSDHSIRSLLWPTDSG